MMLDVTVTDIVTMANLRKKPNSKFWIACFTDQNGKQQQRSTRTVEKSAALRIVLTLEDAFRRKMTEEQLRRVLNDASESLNGRRLVTSTVGDYFAGWLARKTSETSMGTLTRYRDVVGQFQRHLGPQRNARELCRLTVTDFVDFRDHLAKTVQAGTANLAIKILSVATKAAWQESLISENPATKVQPLKVQRSELIRRRPFPLDELRKP